MNIKSAADLRAFVKGFYDSHVTALNGILEKLPDPFKTEFAKLRDGLTAQLEKLPPVDQTPAAPDGAWAFNSFADAWTRMADYSNGLREKLSNLVGDLNAKVTALNGLQQQITDGAYLTKEKATEACTLARSEGAASMRPEILATRKSALESCGLPVPPDAILGLPSADYEGRLTGARDQVGKLAAKGMKVGGKGASWVASMAWLGATEFNGQMTALEEVLGTAPVKPQGDPLLGGPTTPPANPAPAAITLA